MLNVTNLSMKYSKAVYGVAQSRTRLKRLSSKLVLMTGLWTTAVLLDTVGNSESFIICILMSGFEFYFN